MTKEKLKKVYLIVLAAYVTFAVLFYVIGGEQLWYKKSVNTIEMPTADTVSDEINENNTLFESFTCEMDRIEKFAFVFTKNYQDGDGKLTINIKLDGKQIANQTFDVKTEIPEQHRVYIEFPKPIEETRDKEVEITIFSTAKEDDGVRVMSCSTISGLSYSIETIKKIVLEDEIVENNDENISNIEDNVETQVEYSEEDIKNGVDENGNEIRYVEEITNNEYDGTICFSLDGSDRLHIGEFYLPIFGGLGLIIGIILFISYKEYLKGKRDYLAIVVEALYKYKFLINQLVSRDFKTKYKRSVFGILWSFLNPLLTMIVQFIVFSTIFKVDTQNYPVYLISGVVCYGFFNECTTMCLNSISGNYRLITKVYIPKYIFPFSKTLSSSVNLAISLIPLLLVTLITGTVLHWSIVLMFYFLICLIIFSLGIGMILATLMVFFRDIQFIWSVVCTIWQYATPIFYPAEIIPEKYRLILRLNPLYHFIGNLRKCLIDGLSPEPISYLYCLIFAVGALLIGSYVFKKSQDKFTLYL